MPTGAPRHEIDRIKNHLIDAAREVIAEKGGSTVARGIYARIADDSIQIRVFMPDAEIRPVSTGEFTDAWREKVGVVPGSFYPTGIQVF